MCTNVGWCQIRRLINAWQHRNSYHLALPTRNRHAFGLCACSDAPGGTVIRSPVPGLLVFSSLVWKEFIITPQAVMQGSDTAWRAPDLSGYVYLRQCCCYDDSFPEWIYKVRAAHIKNSTCLYINWRGCDFNWTPYCLVQEAVVMLYPAWVIRNPSSTHTRRNQLAWK